MFPWLFPYGYGGLGNEKIQSDLKISDKIRKRLWLTYYDQRFQNDQFFSLIAFNHQQIKNSNDGGFLLAKKQNFKDIVNRIMNVNADTLDDLIRRTKDGLVTPETEEEINCFRILRFLSETKKNPSVDGSITNRRRMRNEIWSLTAYLGAPSWFITFAPADVNHPICLYFADTKQKYWPNIPTQNERIRLIASNPVAGARFFKFITEMFIKHVLG
ncbi:hypothetical protein BC629DRAFT_1292039, partial [Irpex lacteus]